MKDELGTVCFALLRFYSCLSASLSCLGERTFSAAASQQTGLRLSPTDARTKEERGFSAAGAGVSLGAVQCCAVWIRPSAGTHQARAGDLGSEWQQGQRASVGWDGLIWRWVWVWIWIWIWKVYKGNPVQFRIKDGQLDRSEK